MAIPAELPWQQEIIKALVTHQGYKHLSDDDYDRERALVPSEFLAFIANTQPALRERHTAYLPPRPLNVIEKEIGGLSVKHRRC